MSTKPVRTYLDPDAVGPLPRATVADDSDALSAARTILRVPGTNTQEIRPGDVLEVFDPNRRPESIAPTAYDTAGYRVPRTNLARYVVGALAVSGVILVAAAARTFFGGQPSVAAEASASNNAVAAAAPQAIETRQASAPVIPPPPPSSPSITTGTLRVDPAVQGQRVMLDGVLLSVPAALIQCGPHDVAVGASGRSRAIEVPCGGEVTVYR
jgi:hypothetical protein